MIRVEAEVAGSGHPVAVRSLVLHHQQKGLIGVALVVEEIKGEIGDNIRAMTFYSTPPVWKNKLGLIIITLPRQLSDSHN